jgi:hypothetical protein
VEAAPSYSSSSYGKQTCTTQYKEKCETEYETSCKTKNETVRQEEIL